MAGQVGDHHAGELLMEMAAAKGGRTMGEELRRLGWTEKNLATRRKNDPGKLGLTARVRRKTTLSLKALAGAVALGQLQEHERAAARMDARQHQRK